MNKRYIALALLALGTRQESVLSYNSSGQETIVQSAPCAQEAIVAPAEDCCPQPLPICCAAQPRCFIPRKRVCWPRRICAPAPVCAPAVDCCAPTYSACAPVCPQPQCYIPRRRICAAPVCAPQGPCYIPRQRVYTAPACAPQTQCYIPRQRVYTAPNCAPAVRCCRPPRFCNPVGCCPAPVTYAPATCCPTSAICAPAPVCPAPLACAAPICCRPSRFCRPIARCPIIYRPKPNCCPRYRCCRPKPVCCPQPLPACPPPPCIQPSCYYNTPVVCPCSPVSNLDGSYSPAVTNVQTDESAPDNKKASLSKGGKYVSERGAPEFDSNNRTRRMGGADMSQAELEDSNEGLDEFSEPE